MDPIGELFVKIRPSLDGFAKEVADGTATSMSGAMGGVQTASRTALAGVVAVGGGLLALGTNLDESYDKIRTQTGATGTELDSLKASFETVSKGVPSDMDSVSTAIATLNQTLGLTGPELESTAMQMLNLSRVTGEDLNGILTSSSQVFNQFGVDASEQAALLDEFFQTSQATGVGVTDLLNVVNRGGATFEQLGLGLTESADLVGLLGKNGVAPTEVMRSLTRVMADAAKEGVPAAEALSHVEDSIKNAGSEADAVAIAIEAFGAKAGPKLAKQIRDGTISLDDLESKMGKGGDTINAAALETADAAETFQTLKNTLAVSLGPAANKLFASFGKAASDAAPALIMVVDAIAPLLTMITSLPTPVLAAVAGVLAFGSVLGKIIGPIKAVITVFKMLSTALMANPWILLIAGVIALVVVIVKNWDKIKAAIGAALEWIKNIIGVVTSAISAAWSAVWNTVASVVSTVWETIKTIINVALTIIVTVITTYVNIWVTIFTTAWKIISTAIQVVWDTIKTIITTAFKIIGAVIDTYLTAWRVAFTFAWNVIRTTVTAVWDGLKNGISGAAKWISDRIDEIVGFITGLPGRVLEAVLAFTNAGLDLGKSFLDGLKSGLTAVAGFAGDVAGKIIDVFKDAWNTLANMINDFVPNSIGAGPFKLDLPDDPIPTFDTGGVVPGPRGSPQLVLAHGGETILPTHKRGTSLSRAQGVTSAASASDAPLVIQFVMNDRVVQEMLITADRMMKGAK